MLLNAVNGFLAGWTVADVINLVIASGTAAAAFCSYLTARANRDMSRTMSKDYSQRTRPYIGIENYKLEAYGVGVPQTYENQPLTRAKLAQYPNLKLDLKINVKNFGQVPALLKPIHIDYFIDGRPVVPIVVDRERPVLSFPGHVGVIHARFEKPEDVNMIFSRRDALTFHFCVEYSAVGTDEVKQTVITQSYHFSEDDLLGGYFPHSSAEAS